MSIWSDTQSISFSSITTLLLLGPIIAFVYAMYALGYTMKNKGFPKVVLIPYAVLFAVVNTMHNWVVCTIIFKEFPREFFTTQRLKRLKGSEDNSKRELADLLGGLLNRYDIGHY